MLISCFNNISFLLWIKEHKSNGFLSLYSRITFFFFDKGGGCFLMEQTCHPPPWLGCWFLWEVWTAALDTVSIDRHWKVCAWSSKCLTCGKQHHFQPEGLEPSLTLVIYLGNSFPNERFNKWCGRLQYRDHVLLPGDLYSGSVELRGLQCHLFLSLGAHFICFSF